MLPTGNGGRLKSPAGSLRLAARLRGRRRRPAAGADARRAAPSGATSVAARAPQGRCTNPGQIRYLKRSEPGRWYNTGSPRRMVWAMSR
ncbi:MAG: hypothetical protein WCF99_16205 [Chloroflexales bacterium]